MMPRKFGFSLAAFAAGMCIAAGAHGEPSADTHARVALALLPALPGARFSEAAADSDSSLDEYLGEMADSTGEWFGLSAAPRDTAGLDSSLAWHLDHIEEEPRPRPLRLGGSPYAAFNRVDGPVYGGGLWIGEARLLGRLRGDLRYAVGPNEWLGGGTYEKLVARRTARWSVRLGLGRETTCMDRDHPEWHLSSLRAFVTGHDRKHYLRREGLATWIERQTETTRLGLGYRDMRESPLVTTTTWNLVNADLSITSNLPAARGRARELGFEAEARLPLMPVIVEVSHQTSGPSIGSDFDYRRIRATASGEFGVANVATAIPQVFYGRLSGIPTPQQSFYLGGSHSLRSLSSNARAGTHMVVGRLDLIGAFDVLEKLHLPHPDALPLQIGAFAGAGAAWGVDPFGGPTVPGDEWPRKETWIGEAGFSLIYQPGIPDAAHCIRINYALPLGPHRESIHWSASFSRAIDFVHPLGGGGDD
jgi:hypothetical protein